MSFGVSGGIGVGTNSGVGAGLGAAVGSNGEGFGVGAGVGMPGMSDLLGTFGYVSSAAMATASRMGEGASYVAAGMVDGATSAASVVGEGSSSVAGVVADGAASAVSSTAATLGAVASAVPLPPMSSMVPVDLSVDLTTPTDPPPEPYQEGSYPGQPNIPVNLALFPFLNQRGACCALISYVSRFIFLTGMGTSGILTMRHCAVNQIVQTIKGRSTASGRTFECTSELLSSTQFCLLRNVGVYLPMRFIYEY